MQLGDVRLPAWIRQSRALSRELSLSHREFLLLLVLFVCLRLSLLLISRPQGYFYDASDYDFYLEFGRLADRGLYPMLHYWTEYPPVFPWISVAAYRAVEALPTLNGSPIFWLRLALGSFLLLFDIGNLVLIYILGHAIHTPARAIRGAWMYSLLFTPLHVWLGWFDTMPLFFLLLAVTLGVKGRRDWASLAAGFGFMVKILPALAFPTLLRAEQRPWAWVKMVGLATLAAASVALPFLLAAPQFLRASFQSMFSRSPWETPWAIYEGYFGYGQVAPLQDRLDPSTAGYQAYESHLPWTAIGLGFAVLYLLLWWLSARRQDARQGLNQVAFTGLSINLFLLFSKGYSPQFLVYLVPFVLLVVPPLRAVGYLSLLGVINLIEYPVYLALFRDQDWVLRDLVAMRTGILLLLTWEYLVALDLSPRLETIRQLVGVAAALLFLAWAVMALPQAGEKWAEASLQRHPDATLIDYLVANAGSQALVVFTDQGLYREFYPYLHQRTNLLLVDPVQESGAASAVPPGPATLQEKPDFADQVREITEQYREVFGVRQLDDPRGRRLEQLLAQSSRLLSGRRVNDLTVTRWSTHW
ncbi:MAG: glycosyltransferase 87 family protein [Sphingomonadaceae bacterium]